jgi:hypothetical protein
MPHPEPARNRQAGRPIARWPSRSSLQTDGFAAANDPLAGPGVAPLPRMAWPERAPRPGKPRSRTCVLAGVVLALTLLTGCGRMQLGDPTTRDNYRVTLAMEPSPAAVGPGVLAVTLKDDAGKAVNGARLEVEANMSHAGMVPVLAGTAESQAGLYRVPLQWTMAGDWVVDLKFTLPDGRQVARRYPVGVQ